MRISMTKPRGASSLSRRDDNKRIGTAEAALTCGLFSFKPLPDFNKTTNRPAESRPNVRCPDGPETPLPLTPINGHRRTGAVGPVRANGGHEGRYLREIGRSIRGHYADANSSSSAFASFRSRVLKPSVNQP
jgi:hypothetical protein